MEIEIPFYYEVGVSLRGADGQMGKQVAAREQSYATLQFREASKGEMVHAFTVRQALDPRVETGAFPEHITPILRSGGRLYRKMTRPEEEALRRGPIGGDQEHRCFWANFFYRTRERGLLFWPEKNSSGTPGCLTRDEAAWSLINRAVNRRKTGADRASLAEQVDYESRLPRALTSLVNIAQSVLVVDGDFYLMCGEPILREPYPGARSDDLRPVARLLCPDLNVGEANRWYLRHVQSDSYTADMVRYEHYPQINALNNQVLAKRFSDLASVSCECSIEIHDPASLRMDPAREHVEVLTDLEAVLACTFSDLPLAELPAPILDRLIQFRDILQTGPRTTATSYRKFLMELYVLLDRPGTFRGAILDALRIRTENEMLSLYSGHRKRLRTLYLLEHLEATPLNEFKFWGYDEDRSLPEFLAPDVKEVLTKDANTGLLEFLPGEEVLRLERDATRGLCRFYRLPLQIEQASHIPRLPYDVPYAYAVEQGARWRFFGASEAEFRSTPSIALEQTKMKA